MCPTCVGVRAFRLACCFAPALALADAPTPPSAPGEAAPVSPPRVEAPPAEKSSTDDSILFGNGVVGTMLRRSIRLSVRPHLGDFLNEDYLGVTAQTRYGITDDWETSVTLDAYVAHGFGQVPAFSKAGLSRVQFGTRYQLAREPAAPVGTVVGINYRFPVGRPPAAMADAYAHLAPFIIVSRELESHPEWTAFVRVGLDFVSLKTPSAADDDEELAQNSWFVSPGLNWERGDWSWTLSTSYGSTAGLGSEHKDRIGVAPSVNWRLPARWTPGRKGRWVLGLGFSVTLDDDGTDFGVRGSLRTDITLRDLFRRKAKPRRRPALENRCPVTEVS